MYLQYAQFDEISLVVFCNFLVVFSYFQNDNGMAKHQEIEVGSRLDVINLCSFMYIKLCFN